jgi:hypothetical protein
MTTTQHAPSLLTRQGSEWTNELGQTFPAAPLYRCECSCGWRGAAWFASKERAVHTFKRHAELEG